MILTFAKRLLPGVAAAALAVAGCGAESPATGDWGGAVHDSAGVPVVVNPAAGLWTESTAWRLEEDLRIGVADGDPVRQFGRIAGIAVDGGGRIYVLDRQAAEIRVFDRDGRFVRAFGRPGGGPGELRSPSAVLLGPGDTIFVPDMRNQRVQRFLTDGSDAGAFPVSVADGVPLEWRIRPDGLLLEQVRTLPGPQPGAGDERVLVLARASDGEARDTLAEMPAGEALRFRNGQPQMTVFAPEPMWTVLTDGRIATGRTSAYRLEFRNPDGRLDRVVRMPHERLPFGEADRRELQALLRERFENRAPSPATARMLQSLSYADHYPVFAALFGGPDGTLWVRHARDVAALGPDDMEDFNVLAFGAPDYDVFDRDGRFLGTLTLPDRFEPLHTAGDHVYGVQRDDLGVPYVVRLRVVR